MPISPALLEEYLEDTKRLAASIVQYADRWSRYGEQLESRMSESQREDMGAALNDFLFALESLGVEDLPTSESC